MPQQETKVYSYEVKREGGEDILYIDYLGAPYVPSIAESPDVMARTIDALTENPNVSRVIFVQQKNYNHDLEETSMLLEIAQLYTYFAKQEKILSREKIGTLEQFFSQRYNELFNFLLLLKQDPLSAYAELRKVSINAKVFLDKLGLGFRSDQENYIGFLERINTLLENTVLIQKAMP